MSAPDIGPGDIVECVQVERPGLYRVGALYVVAEVIPWPATNQTALVIKDMPPSRHPTGGWCSTGFRPVHSRRKHADLIERLLEPVKSSPVKVEA